MDPSTRRPLTLQSFCYDLAPPLVCYFLTAVLVLVPNTYPIRLALLPITVYVAFRAATELDLGKGLPNEEHFAYLSHGLLLAMSTLVMRVSIWSFQLTPYVRHKPSASLVLDALDLSFNLRGIGWSWSTGLKIPNDSRHPSNKSIFLRQSLRDFVQTYLLFDFFLFSVQSFHGLDSPTGASIFDPLSPPIQRYAKSTLISLLSGFTVYTSINLVYLLLSLLSILLFAHSPADWPPAFDQPWRSTSLTHFWSTGWHQFFRHNFIAFAGVPASFLFGRLAALFAVFLASGLLHHFGLWGMGRGVDFLPVVGFFLLMGLGILFEHVFKAVTGKRVQGFLGWVWVMLWVLGWANFLVEAWLSRGLAGSIFQPQHTRPSIFLVRRLRDIITNSSS